jgi:hypothetical protein
MGDSKEQNGTGYLSSEAPSSRYISADFGRRRMSRASECKKHNSRVYRGTIQINRERDLHQAKRRDASFSNEV